MKRSALSILQPMLRCKRFAKSHLQISSILCCIIFLATASYAQQPSGKSLTIKGIITGQRNEPLQAVTVAVKGDTKATSTKSDGSFELQAPANSTLIISSVGYANREIKLGSNDQLTFSLQLTESNNQLDQVVVVGYGTRKKSDVTGAIVSISEQSIKDIPAANLAQALQGQGAGIDIQKTGGNSKPGATPSILIRGSRSVQAGNNPLIVVDGIPFNGKMCCRGYHQ